MSKYGICLGACSYAQCCSTTVFLGARVLPSLKKDLIFPGHSKALNNFRSISGHDDWPYSFLLGHVSFLAGQMYMMNYSFRGDYQHMIICTLRWLPRCAAFQCVRAALDIFHP